MQRSKEALPDAIKAEIDELQLSFKSTLKYKDVHRPGPNGLLIKETDAEASSEELKRYLVAVSAALARASVFAIDAVGYGLTFNRFTINGDLDLSNTRLHATSFADAQFHGKVNLSNATVVGSVDFSRALFRDDAVFQNARCGRMTFVEAIFHSAAHFHCIEIGSADFDKVVFEASADFSQSIFRHSATFRQARFDLGADFAKTVFQEHATFRDASFSRKASFHRCRFWRDANFSGSCFSEELDASYALFIRRADFTKSKFLKTTDFSFARFQDAPWFHDCSFSHDTRFIGIKCQLDGISWTSCVKEAFRNWRKADGASFSDFFKGVSSMWAEDRAVFLTRQHAFRTLRHQLGSLRAQKEEGVFFALEQRAMRFAAPFWQAPFQSFLSWAYDFISGYGEEPGRAFGVWWVMNVFFFFVYLVFDVSEPPLVIVNSACADCAKAALVAFPPLGLTLQNALNPLALLGDKPLFIVPHFFVLALSALQGIFSIGIFTMFLLAVRRRFYKGNE